MKVRVLVIKYILTHLGGDVIIWVLQISKAMHGAILAYQLPAIISFFVIICTCTFDLGKNIYLYCKSKKVRI